MVSKNELKRLLEEEKQLRRDDQARIRELEGLVDFYKCQQEKDKLIVEELKKKDGLNQVYGSLTVNSNCVANIFSYIEKEEKDKAKTLLDILFSNNPENELRVFKFEDEYRKEFFSPDRNIQIQNSKLKESWLFIRHRDRGSADISNRIYQVINKEMNKEKESGTHAINIPINIPGTIQVHEYILIKEVIGPNLFEFNNELSKKYGNITTVARDALIDALIDEQLEYNAFLRTRSYGFPESQLVFPSFEEKMLDFYEKQGIRLKPEQEKKLIELVKPLNKRAIYPVRDGIPMNYSILAKAAEYFLSREFIFQEELPYSGIYEDVKKRLRKAFFSYDHDDLVKRSFQSEDAILSIECYTPPIPTGKRVMLEQSSVEKLRRAGESVEGYWDYRGLEGWIKHSRWALVRQFNPNYPDTKERTYWQHHIDMAHAGLFLHVFKRHPSANEIEKITPEKTLTELVMHPDCRA